MNASQKSQNMLGTNTESYIVLLSDRDEALFRVLFKDEWREPLELLMSDFIAVKGASARGKRVTTYEVDTFEDITPAPQEPEPEENDEEEPDDDENIEETPKQPEDTEGTDEPKVQETADPLAGIKLEITAEIPEDSLPPDSDGQMSLF